jgi:hypothetical protein
MRAIVVHEAGGPEVLRLEEVGDPAAGKRLRKGGGGLTCPVGQRETCVRVQYHASVVTRRSLSVGQLWNVC